ncbi:cytochrome P450 [Mycena vitilis]|nr:cytochrome P450 [Mycena vitilis]
MHMFPQRTYIKGCSISVASPAMISISLNQYSKLLQALVLVVGSLLCYVIFQVSRIAYRNATSPLRHLKGPKSPSFLLGNFKEMIDDPRLTTKWEMEFGRTFLYKSLFSINELYTSDITAISRILTNGSLYQKTSASLSNAEIMLGSGLLAVENDEHRRHRKIMNPAFGVGQIRLMTEVFFEKGAQLRDIWAQQLDNDGVARINVSAWLLRATLDIIGQAGFNYQFESLQANGNSSELNEVFNQLFHSPEANRYTTFRMSQGIFPILKLVPWPGRKLTHTTREKMFAIGRQLVATSKTDVKGRGEGTGDKRDLLSILVKANMSTAIPEKQRMSEAEVVAQMPTFFFAGHETTSSAMAWALHVLSENPAVQNKLREELLTIPKDDPTMDELNALPYLESVIRETMRLHPPVIFTQRMAVEDDVLPLSTPYTDRLGKTHNTIPIPKGQMLQIPILAVNTDKDIWGQDAAEFNPERWEKVPEAASAIPSVWAHQLTFLAGPHNCIGFRFSLVEIKVLLFTLIRAFEFEPALPKGAVGPVLNRILQRPGDLTNAGKGIPLVVKPYKA